MRRPGKPGEQCLPTCGKEVHFIPVSPRNNRVLAISGRAETAEVISVSRRATRRIPKNCVRRSKIILWNFVSRRSACSGGDNFANRQTDQMPHGPNVRQAEIRVATPEWAGIANVAPQTQGISRNLAHADKGLDPRGH